MLNLPPDLMRQLCHASEPGGIENISDDQARVDRYVRLAGYGLVEFYEDLHDGVDVMFVRVTARGRSAVWAAKELERLRRQVTG